MCQFWSCILTREGDVLWSPDTDSHEELVSRNNLKDGKLVDRDFVRIEINPVDATSKARGDWRYKVDEEGTLPVWYESNTRHWERVVWDTWGEAMQQTLWAAPWFDRLCDLVERLKSLRPGKSNVSRTAAKAALGEYEKRLKAQDKQQRQWTIKEVRFYTPTEWASVWDSVRASVWASVRDSIWDSVWASVRDSVRASVWDSVWDSIWDSVWASVRDSVRASVRASVWASVWDSIWDSVRASVISQDEDNYGLPLLDCLEAGCVLYGVDKGGVAHVVMVGKDGGQ